MKILSNIFFIVCLAFTLYSCKEKSKSDTISQNGNIAPNSLANTKVNIKSTIVDLKEVAATSIKNINPSESSSNIKNLGLPKIIIAGQPKSSQLVKADLFSANPEKKLAQLPEINQSLPFRTREVNPQNIKFLDIEQGLKNSLIYSVIEDAKGGIWMATKMGITKYDGKFLTSYTEKQGLISNNVSALLQDKNGNLWIGTRGNGLCMFDGKYFYNYKSDSVLINNSILSIYQDKKGAIWLGTDLGAICLKENKFEVYSRNQGIKSNVSSILEDKQGDIILTTYENGVYKISGDKILNYTSDEGLADNSILSSFKDNKGNLWFGGNSLGLCMFNGKQFINYNTDNGLSSNSITAISQNSKNELVIGFFNGGYSTLRGNEIKSFTEKEGLNNKTVLSLCCDKFDNIWLGTEGSGIAKYSSDLFTHLTINEGLSNSLVWSTVQDKNGDFWIGTGGGGLNNKKDNKFFCINKSNGLNSNIIQKIIIDNNNNVIIGTFEGGFGIYKDNNVKFYTTNEGLTNNTIWSLVEDKYNNIWTGTNSGFCKFNGATLVNYTQINNIDLSSVFSIFEDKIGNMWFATNGNGVIKYDGTSFQNFTSSNGLIDNVVSCIYEDSFGNIWFGSQNGGISRFDGKKFVNLNESNGLSNNAVLSLIEDNDKNMWFGTRSGLNKLNKKLVNLPGDELISNKKLFTTYGVSEGFTGNNCARNSVYKDNTGKIWWGTGKMLTIYNPEADKKDSIAPIMQITGLKLFFDDVNWSNFKSTIDDSTSAKHEGISFDSVSYWNAMPVNLSLPYHQNHVTLNYIGINFKSQDKILYEYILEGFEDEWNPITNKTEAVYSNLPAGNFTFKVKAMNKDGLWSEPISYSFTVTPPWWKTWWFRTLAIIIIVATVWFYIKQRERVLRQRQLELEKTVEERTHEVVEQKEIIEEKQKEILDSINYAKRIQRALLASIKLLDENLKTESNKQGKAEDYFVYFQPKDIVSGDFYWASNLSNGNFAVVTADSTGHGVPGAIMSMLNISCLNEAVNGKELTNAADILNHTRTKVIANLANDGSAEGGKDGMDCSVICYDFKNLKMNYAAANNPIWVVRKMANENGELVKTMIELKPDKMPCGKHDRDHEPFNSYEFDLQKGDLVYALTDGFPDQFGGEKGKKYMYKKLKEFLVENAHYPMEKQYKFLNAEFNYWKQDKEQVDDVLIIGVRV